MSRSADQTNERTPLLASTSRDTLDAPQAPQTNDIISRLSAILGALKAGKLPSTEQLDSILSAALDSDVLLATASEGGPRLKGRLSQPTYELLLHLRSGLEAVLNVLRDKNRHDEVQEFAWSLECVLALAAHEGSGVDSSTEDVRSALASARTLVWLVLRNVLQESRALVEDLVWTLRTAAADTAQDVSQRANAAAQTLRPEDLVQEEADGGGRVQDAIKGQDQDVKAGLDRRRALAEEQGRQRVLLRLNKAMQSIRTDPESTRAASTLLDLARKYLDPETASTFRVSEPMQSALKDVRRGFLRFLAPWSEVDVQSDQFQAQWHTLLQGPRSNDEIRALLESVVAFAQSLLAEPTFAQSQEASQQWDDMARQAQLIKEQHSDWWEALTTVLHTAQAALSQAAQDPDVQTLAGSLSAFTASAMNLSQLGARTLLGETRGLVSDLVNVLLPRLLGTLTRCPFPRVEYKSPFMDAVVRGLFMSCDDFVLQELYPLPTYFRFNTNSTVAYQSSTDFSSQNAFDAASAIEAQDASASNRAPAEFHSQSQLFLRGIHFSARDISFYIRRKAFYWLPCFREETGFLDFTLAEGAEADIEFVNTSPSRESGRFVDVKSVTVRLPGLDLRVRQSFHPWLMWMTRPLVRSALKVALRYVLSSQLKEAIEAGDAKLFKLKQKATAYEARGFATGQAWFAALMERDPAEQVQEEQQQQQQESQTEERVPSAQRNGDNNQVPGLHFTSKGVVKPLDAAQESALAVGAGAQLLPDSEAGPEYFGPSGPHGSGSGGRIAAELDAGTKTAVEELRVAQTQGRQAVQQVGEVLRDVPRAPERMHRVEQREARRESTWKSPVFSL